jgi:choline dehydrogenase-like flavoprotein
VPSSMQGKNQGRSTLTEFLNDNFGGRLTSHAQMFAQTFTKRIFFDGKNARAVEADICASVYRVNTKREVTLFCGAFHTSQLLMVSGVSKRQLSSEHNISLVHALLGVGRNL